MTQKDQSGSKTLSQGELESIIRGTNFDDQSSATNSLQKHGLSSKMNGDTAEIYDASNNRVASVQFNENAQQGQSQSSGQQRQIGKITY